MKKLLAVACVSAVVPYINAGYFGVYNNTKDSFAVERYLPNSDIIVSDCQYPSNDMKNTEILGGTKIEYDVIFTNWSDKYANEKPFLSFRNGEYEFKAVFTDGINAILDSSTASELHNNSRRDGYDHEYIGDFGSQYIGCIINWLIVGPYRVVYFYEKNGGRGRGWVIEYTVDDNSWMRKIEEDDYACRIGLKTYLPMSRSLAIAKQPWWSRLCCCCCGCCDD
jgi:hypothetical protein